MSVPHVFRLQHDAGDSAGYFAALVAFSDDAQPQVSQRAGGAYRARSGACETVTVGSASDLVHVVSVGEVLAVSGLIERLHQSFSRHRIVVSTTTASGQKLARDKFGEKNVFYFPLDFGFAIRPFLRALRPRLVMLPKPNSGRDS